MKERELIIKEIEKIKLEANDANAVRKVELDELMQLQKKKLYDLEHPEPKPRIPTDEEIQKQNRRIELETIIQNKYPEIAEYLQISGGV